MSDEALKRFGYAPGGYMNKCHACGETFSNLDKRARTCKRCALLAAQFVQAAADREDILRAELARKDAALREYQPHIDTMRAVIENRGQAYPTDRDGIRGMVDAAMKLFEIEVRSRTLLSSSPSQASVVVPTDDLKWLIFGRETAGPLHDDDKARVARLRSLLGAPNV